MLLEQVFVLPLLKSRVRVLVLLPGLSRVHFLTLLGLQHRVALILRGNHLGRLHRSIDTL